MHACGFALSTVWFSHLHGVDPSDDCFQKSEGVKVLGLWAGQGSQVWFQGPLESQKCFQGITRPKRSSQECQGLVPLSWCSHGG